jgi:hypothetical protein
VAVVPLSSSLLYPPSSEPLRRPSVTAPVYVRVEPGYEAAFCGNLRVRM